MRRAAGGGCGGRPSRELAHGVLDASVEGGVGVDHLARRRDRDLGVDGEGEQPENLPTVGANGDGTDQDVSIGSATSLMTPSLPDVLCDPSPVGHIGGLTVKAADAGGPGRGREKTQGEKK